jgi:ribosomal protein S18 acetylase RimI-like enzyme
MYPSQRTTPLVTEPQLRPAHHDDVAAVATVWESGWSDGHRGHVPVELEAHRTRSAFTRLAERRVANTVVAVDDGHVVGFIVVVHDELEQMYVASSHRGHGVADLLISHAQTIIGARYAT